MSTLKIPGVGVPDFTPMLYATYTLNINPDLNL